MMWRRGCCGVLILILIFFLVIRGMGEQKGVEIQVCGLESYPLYSRCRTHNWWKGLATCFRVAR